MIEAIKSRGTGMATCWSGGRGAGIGKSRGRGSKVEENKETKEQRTERRRREESNRMNEVGTIRRGKETYITTCAVRTLAEEFGRRLRSP